MGQLPSLGEFQDSLPLLAVVMRRFELFPLPSLAPNELDILNHTVRILIGREFGRLSPNSIQIARISAEM